MKVLDLFSGIGGFSLGLERAGFETVAFCEIEEYPRKILKKHWPDVPIHKDIRSLDGHQYRGTVDVICGGFPCQPFSVAGKQRGETDDRHLWPEMLRIIKEVQPTYVIGENVSGFVSMALDDVSSDLENEGYEVQSFIIPACAVNAVHRRDRVWLVAHSCGSNGGRSRERAPRQNGERRYDERIRTQDTTLFERSGSSPEVTPDSCEGGVNADTSTPGVQTGLSKQRQGQERLSEVADNDCDRRGEGRQPSIPIPTESPVRHRDDGLPDNVARLKALGNAVVPQIPEIIGRAIMEVERENLLQTHDS